jgi:hypothetical protein
MRPNTGQLVELLVHCTARGKHWARKITLLTELTMMGVECKDSTLTQICICGESNFRTQTGNLLFVTTQLAISLTLPSTTTTTSIIQ